MTDSYEAWCMEQPYELEEEYRALYSTEITLSFVFADF